MRLNNGNDSIFSGLGNPGFYYLQGYEMKKVRGRPNRNGVSVGKIGFRVNQDEKDAVELEADKKGLTVADYLRKRVFR